MKKILVLILAVLMVLPIVVSCANPSEDPAVTSGQAETVPPETEDPFADNVPEADYEEYEFIIAAPETWGSTYFDREEETADAINDAIYTRNRQLEQRFNITISSMNIGFTHEQAAAFSPYAMAGTDVVSMIGVAFYQSGKPMITSGYALPWNDVPYINLDKDWWNKSVTQTLSVLGNYYYLSGAINWPTYTNVMTFYFNKKVAEDYKDIVGNIYDTVRDGDWTQDLLLDYCKKITRDNGDSVWDENDIYGHLQYYYSLESYVYGSDYQTVYMTDDGPILNISTTKLSNIINYVYDLVYGNHLAYMCNGDDNATLQDIFFDDRALFYNGTMGVASNWRAYDTDFGIIPIPKYDKEQAQYKTYSDQWGLVCCLPCTAADTDRTGAIIEAMAALSKKLITPAYYEKTLMGKIKRDDESEEMLEIIFGNVLYDTGITFCTDLNLIPLRSCITGRNKNLTSWYKSFKKKLEKNYQELYDYVLAQQEAE